MQRDKVYMIIMACSMLMMACRNVDTSYIELDALISERQSIQTQYQHRIDSVYLTSLLDTTDGFRFACYGQLFDMYRAFNIDSQLTYAQKRLVVADKLNNIEYKQAAQLNKAEVLMRSGMYYEAMTCINEVAQFPIAHFLQPYYFHLHRTLYGLLADFAITKDDKHIYDSLTQNYRDSIMQVQPVGSFVYELVRADALAAGGAYDEALEVLLRYDSLHTILPEEQAAFSITMAQIYEALGDVDTATPSTTKGCVPKTSTPISLPIAMYCSSPSPVAGLPKWWS